MKTFGQAVWLVAPFAALLSKVVCCRCFKLCQHIGKVRLNKIKWKRLTFYHIQQVCCRLLKIFSHKNGSKNKYSTNKKSWKHCGNIAHYEQVVLLPRCFRKSSVCGKGYKLMLFVISEHSLLKLVYPGWSTSQETSTDMKPGLWSLQLL